MVKRLKSTAFLLAGIAFLLALPGQAASARPAGAVTAAPAGEAVQPLFLVDDRGQLHWAGLDEDPLAFLKRTALADACQGGNCQTGLGGVLSCPTSGGPTCGSSQPCACICSQMPNGSWSSVNYCMSA
jgi:hypothetical protein